MEYRHSGGCGHKILKARATAEVGAQKKEEKAALQDWLRSEELRLIPIKDRTKSEAAEYQWLYRKLKKQNEEAQPTIDERVKNTADFGD